MAIIQSSKTRYRVLRLVGGGILLGACLAAVMLLWQPTLRAERGRTISPAVFRGAVKERPGTLRSIVVFPVSRTGDGTPVQFVTGQVSERRDLMDVYSDFTFVADVPFQYAGASPQTATITDFLKGDGRTGSPVPFSYAWWSTTTFIITACLIGSLLLTVGVMPGIAAGLRLVAGIFRTSPDTAAPQVGQISFASGSVADERHDAAPLTITEEATTPAEVVDPLPAAEGLGEPAAPAQPVSYAAKEYYPVARPAGKGSKVDEYEGR